MGPGVCGNSLYFPFHFPVNLKLLKTSSLFEGKYFPLRLW